jgi:hypothetical protein
MTEPPREAADQSGLAPFEFDFQRYEVPGDDEVVLFPEYMDGDVAVYRPAVIQLAKRLSAEGLNVRYAFPPEQRTWLRELSAEEVIQQLVIGVASGIPLFVLGQVLGRRAAGRVKLSVTMARKVKGKRMWDAEVVEISGSAEDVSRTLRKMGTDSPDE